MGHESPFDDAQQQRPGDLDIAIIGMAGSFPGAANVDEFWINVLRGKQNIETVYGPGPAGADSAADGAAVRAGGVLDGVDLFDAAFFGYSPREAELLDPQHRVFLECAWSALEDAGYGASGYRPAIGVYAGTSLSTYLLYHLLPNPQLAELQNELFLSNIPDTLATRTAYQLDLGGPAVTAQTACSTSLVAVHLACQALLAGDCEIALAGGVSVRLPQLSAHHARGDGIMSPDGRCLPFDAEASGTVNGNGVGAIVLKPLSAALSDGDGVRAVIRATAVNNDGRRKVGFTAPSVQGQACVVRAAHEVAGCDPADFGYLETHGTATALGDPIEFAALREAFAGRDVRRDGRCTLGSVKALIGHLDAAAGIAGLIKTVLALEHATLPPSPYFQSPNPAIDLADSPFQLVTQAQDWPRIDGARRLAAVSSFGMGGTNAHVVLEEAPPRRPAESAARPQQLIVLSGRTPSALGAARARLRAHLSDGSGDSAHLADIAHTLRCGRTAFPYRLALVADNAAAAAAALDESAPGALTGRAGAERREVVFMFSGQGTQYPGMGAGLYRTEAVYRAAFDECADLLAPTLGRDLRDLVLRAEADGPGADAAALLRRTEYAQPALFAVEYALARLWTDWGVRPAAMIGHSIGEYAAACLAGTMSLPAALNLVAARGRLMQAMAPGSMLSVALAVDEAERWTSDEVVIAASNGPALTTLAGPAEALGAVEKAMAEHGIAVRTLHTSHAFHSPAMDPLLDEFRELVAGVTLEPPAVPFVANLTGTWITDEQATSPDYWASHLRHRVRFHEGLATLAGTGPLALLEVGPGAALGTLARQSLSPAEHAVAASLPQPGRPEADGATTADALARLWLAGIEPDWAAYGRREPRVRVGGLPTYPFERARYWIEPPADGRAPHGPAGSAVAETGQGPDHAGAAPALAEYPRAALATAFVAPRDEREERIAAVWRDVLGIAEIGVHDNFFELGGHSLLGVRVAALLLDVFDLELPAGALMGAPTVAELAALLHDLSADADELTAVDEDGLLAALLAELDGGGEGAEQINALLGERTEGRIPEGDGRL